MSVIGDKIKEARKSKKLSQATVAKAIGLTQAALSEFETGKSVPRGSTLILFARYFDNNFGEEWLNEYLDESKNSHKTVNDFPPEIGVIFSGFGQIHELDEVEKQETWTELTKLHDKVMRSLGKKKETNLKENVEVNK